MRLFRCGEESCLATGSVKVRGWCGKVEAGAIVERDDGAEAAATAGVDNTEAKSPERRILRIACISHTCQELYLGQVARSLSQGRLASRSGAHIPNTELSCFGMRTRPPCVLHLKVVRLELTYEI